MPLPWLIGAAVVAAAAAVVKAVSDDDSPSSSSSGDAERRRQEREAQLQRERDGLAAQVVNLKKDRLEEARELLALSAEALEQLPRKTVGLSTSNFETALMAKLPASSEYAQSLGAILDLADYGEKDFTQKERGEFLVNLQILESLYGAISVSSERLRDLAALREAGSRLNSLQDLKHQLEQQG
ncbi:hypothetical protein ACR96V_31745 [Pseudomonas aeruginosa]|uniref:hypothetical protein n=1 Tax=Pseudomonas aeruginosa TaxID=287 RepID=UPI00068BDD89|nr:hypothetical protein [Pseudomonas aeruginosa]MBX6190334.1 hypothetical protein [Pseudomonas aeruginosa]MBX6717008.1 hypothetical protein [Pseudomonas aeruginosa]MBX6872487.1 hypothetical protein [Pseudomonas aeruginosa]MCS7706831.1 hypothetical protein [Pseudomonas aeruginosa]QKL12944.1 hypothetical protein GEV42_13145 [Pseudomonas aeruginosa]